VLAQHRQFEAFDRACGSVCPGGDGDVVDHDAVLGPDAACPNVGLRIEPVGQYAPVNDPGDQLLHLWMIRAEHCETIEGDILDEGVEGVAYALERAVMVQMLRVDVRDDRDSRRQLYERAVRLVGLNGHPFALAQPCIGAIGVDDAAVDHCWIVTRGIQEGGHHRSGRRLSVRSADGDGPFQAHQLAEHLGTPHHRQKLCTRRINFRVAATDGRGADDNLRRAEILSAVTDMNLDSEVAQALDVRAVGNVAALHAVAEIVHDLGYPAHADSADPDEVQGADIEGHRVHAATPRSGSAPAPTPCAVNSASTRSASRRAASGPPRFALAAAAAPNWAGSVRIAARRSVSVETVSSRCVMTHAAPETALALAVW